MDNQEEIQQEIQEDKTLMDIILESEVTRTSTLIRTDAYDQYGALVQSDVNRDDERYSTYNFLNVYEITNTLNSTDGSFSASYTGNVSVDKNDVNYPIEETFQLVYEYDSSIHEYAPHQFELMLNQNNALMNQTVDIQDVYKVERISIQHVSRWGELASVKQYIDGMLSPLGGVTDPTKQLFGLNKFRIVISIISTKNNEINFFSISFVPVERTDQSLTYTGYDLRVCEKYDHSNNLEQMNRHFENQDVYEYAKLIAEKEAMACLQHYIMLKNQRTDNA